MPREILVADPNKAAHKAFEEVFKGTDYNLIFSENGEDALLKMKLFKPALVIADVTMSDKGGKELCQVLKGDPDLNEVPFVLLGGPFDDDIEEDKNQVRADGAITKPLQKEPILKLVDGLLTGERVGGTREVEGEILELQPMDEVAETAGSRAEEEVIDLVDIIEEPTAKTEEALLGALGEAVRGEEARESEEAGIFGTEAFAGFEFPEDTGVKKGEEAIQAPEMEIPESMPDLVTDLKGEPAKVEDRVFPEEEMVGLVGFEETPESERAEFKIQESAEGIPTEEIGELPEDFFKEEDATEEIEQIPVEKAAKPEGLEVGVEGVAEELPTEGIGELPQDVLKEWGLEDALAEEMEGLPEEEAADLEGLEVGVEGVAEELPTEGIGELPQDVLKERGLEEALAEEIEELPEDLLGEKGLEEPFEKWKVRPDDEEGGLEGFDLGQETEARAEEEENPEEALRELPGEAPEEERLEEFPEVDLPAEGLEGPPREASQEMDLEGLAEKVLKEDDLQAFGEESLRGDEFGEFHEEVFKEGELEKLAEEATRERESEEIPEGALAEAIEEFTGETLRGGEGIGVRLSRHGPMQEAIRELVEGVSAKIIPRLTEAIAAAAVEKIEKAVEKIVPELAEKAIQKEIQRLEDLKKGDDLDV